MARRQAFRLDSGGRIDRSRPLGFSFNGRSLEGYAGDTMASALLANGVRTVNRSLKFRRPRGIMAAGVEETNALLTAFGDDGELPLTRTTLRPLTEGLRLQSPRGTPSVNWDLGGVLDRTHRLWPAGFYNKTFKWPSWRWYEWAVRRLAGMGRLPGGEDRRAYFEHHAHCDVLVVGAGPAGLAAALSAKDSGARVVLAEQDVEPGGSLLARSATIDALEADAWLTRARTELAQADNVTLMTRATVTGHYDHGVLTVTDRSTAGVVRYWTLRARQVVLACGAIEQPLVFEHNDRPGVMLAGAALSYLHRYAVMPAPSMAVATNNDSAYAVAFALHDRGVPVPLIVDSRAEVPAQLAAEVRARGLALETGAVVVRTDGGRAVRGVRVARLAPDGRSPAGPSRAVACGGVAMSGGYSPLNDLYSQAGGTLRYDRERACFLPDQCRQATVAAGAANGAFGLGEALDEGARAGAAAATRAGFTASARVFATGDSPAHGPLGLRITPGGRPARQWVDFMHDVTVADIELAVRENFVSVEHLKRHTTCGMAPDQGKTSNLNALTLLAQFTGRDIATVGTTTFRPQFMPVPLGAIAGLRRGELYHPLRRLPAHDWHAARGAQFEDYGAWQRPAWYARAGLDGEQAIEAEMLAVRRAAGLFDASPLGKIELVGPGAGEFLDRVFVNDISGLGIGRCRYVVALNDNGIVIEDGIVSRLAEQHYLVNSTSAQAEHFVEWLEQWHQCAWPELDLVIAPVTPQWAVATLAGPRARALLQALPSELDFSAAALPHMALVSGTLLGMPARVQRVSFTGEPSYEISVAARHAEALFEALLGGAEGPTLFGIEALDRLRIEKGYWEVGVDSDGATNALDLGLGRVVKAQRSDFIGRRSLAREWDRRGDRRQLVGLESLKPSALLRAGAHLLAAGGAGGRSQGIVTSVCRSPVLQRTVALGLLEGGFARNGEELAAWDEGRLVPVKVVEPAFYDPGGERLRG